jgi:hypothetical protein
MGSSSYRDNRGNGMAQTPGERRAKRDEYARGLTDPRSGQPFKNYNALDTWQRNERAKAKGYESRTAQRKAETVTLAQTKFPGSFPRFLGGRKPTETLAREFLKAWGPYTQAQRQAAIAESHRLRQEYLDSDDSDDWNWTQWREEYSSL